MRCFFAVAARAPQSRGLPRTGELFNPREETMAKPDDEAAKSHVDAAADTGMRRGLTSYGDAGFSLFLR